MKLSPLIKERTKLHNKAIKQLWEKINEYDDIIIYRHEMPDYDALGTQLGLATWIKDNFPHKTIHTVGENHVVFTPRLYPMMDILPDSYYERKFLAIVVDTGNSKRVSDKSYAKAAYIIKIDHHPDVERYAKISIVDDQMTAAAELVVNILCKFPGEHILSKEAAIYFYSALAGDSSRFLFDTTVPHTFEIAKILVNTGFALGKDVYHKMYAKNIEDLQVTAYVLNHFHVSPRGVAYYVLDKDVQERLNITVERGKENLGTFSNIENIAIWCSITEDPKKGIWKVSIRSKMIPINHIAEKYCGGGHEQASGAEITTLDELPNLIADLDALIPLK